jgi:hypothetical protein
MIVWLTLWTIGGVCAMRELLRMLWSEDRISTATGALTVSRRLGPFRTRRTIPREELTAVYVLPRAGALVAETATESIELSTLGSCAKRERVAAALRTEFGLDLGQDVETGTSPPDGWQEIVDAEGHPALVTDLRNRRIQARIVIVMAVGAATVAFLLVRASVHDSDLIPLAAMAVAAAAGLGWGASWLARGRLEWRIGSGSLLLRRRHGSRVRDLFEARALELTFSSDSDGDHWFELEAIAPELPERSSQASKKERRRVARVINDPREPRRLGRWLAKRAGLPFVDRVPVSHRAEELARLKAELPKAGALGRMALRLIEKAESRRGAEGHPDGRAR